MGAFAERLRDRLSDAAEVAAHQFLCGTTIHLLFEITYVSLLAVEFRGLLREVIFQIVQVDI